jgi:lysozyme family protein
MPRPDRFAACVAEVLRHGGGYVDHPRDPGGCTNRGITRRTLEGWRREPVSCEDVRALTEADRRQHHRGA